MKRILVAASLAVGIIMASCGEPKETTTNNTDSTATNSAPTTDTTNTVKPDTTTAKPDTTTKP